MRSCFLLFTLAVAALAAPTDANLPERVTSKPAKMADAAVTHEESSKGRIVLHSSRAVTHGEDLRYFDGELKNALGNWITESDWASWAFTVDQPGTYQIQLWQGCGVHSGGSVVTVSCAGQTSTFNVEETGHFQKFVRRTVGKVTFEKAGPQTLEVRAKTKPGAAVMDLRQIILVPDPAPKP